MNTVAKLKLLPVVLSVLTLAACGGEQSNPAVGEGSEAGNGTDLAFATQMVEHHEGAIEMAELAGDRAGRPEIRGLAEDIVASQQREVGVLEQASERLEAAGVEAADLGIPAHMSGMEHDGAALEDAKPFDRAFIDAMVPHHQGAIRMARVELEKGSDGELKSLARDVVASQSREIKQMNEWRTEWYGKPSPAGGVPAAEDAGSQEEDRSGH